MRMTAWSTIDQSIYANEANMFGEYLALGAVIAVFILIVLMGFGYID